MLNKIRKMLKQQEGFTLVELMIVVVILGIISGIGIQQYGKVQENARLAADDANVRIIQSATQMYLMMADTEVKSVTVADLVTERYLEDAPKSPWDKTTDYEIELSEDKPPKIIVTNSYRP